MGEDKLVITNPQEYNKPLLETQTMHRIVLTGKTIKEKLIQFRPLE